MDSMTIIPLDKDNRMLRIGFGKNKGAWFARIDLWCIGIRLTPHINTNMTKSKQWRIKRISTQYSNMRTVTIYILQKRLLGFLWWYNPDNIDAYTTGWYDSYHDAEKAYQDKMSISITTYTDLDDAR